MTFAEILADAYRRCRYATSPDTTVVTRIKAFVNEVQDEIYAHPSLRSLHYGTTTLSATASRERYGRIQTLTVRNIVDSTHQITLRPRSLSWYRANNPDPANNEGIPEWYIPLGPTPIARAPASTGSGLWVESTSASDTTQTIAIDAVRLGGAHHSPSATTLTGTTRVAIGGGSALTDYIDVLQFAVSAACAGDIVLYDAASGGNALSIIPRGFTTARYWGLILSPTPSEAIDYTVDVEHELFPLVNNTDEPIISPRFHRLLAIGARVREYEYQKDSRYGVAKAEYDAGLAALVHTVTCPPEYIAVPGSRTESIGSNLGPWFPEGRW